LFSNVARDAAAPSADEAAKGAEKRAAVDAALAAAPRSIQGARYAIGSQQHFYMEPQASGTLQHSHVL
jgi:xanthine dehydrogenase molybdopterin-binding subunit B